MQLNFVIQKQIQKEQKYSSDALSLFTHIAPGLALRLLEINTKNTNTDAIASTYANINTGIKLLLQSDRGQLDREKDQLTAQKNVSSNFFWCLCFPLYLM